MHILIIPTSKNPNNRIQEKHEKLIKDINNNFNISQFLPEDIEFGEELKKADIVLTQNLGVIRLNEAPNLKWIHLTSAGVNNLTDELKNSDVIITNSSGVHPIPISEHVLGFMLILSRNFDQLMRNQISGEWGREVDRPICELAGKTVCIVGLGQIGERVAMLGEAFGMETFGVVRDIKTPRSYVKRLFGSDQLDEAVTGADYVVNCLPGTPDTKYMFNEKLFNKFKRGSYFINIGRGTSVKESDLIEALNKGILSGAGLDVFETEPLPKSSPLWKMKNVVITPHFSGWSPNSGDRMIEIFCKNLKAFLDKKDMPNLVNKELGY